MRAYKFLRPDGTGVFTRFAWPEDEWVEAPVDPCRSGVHACRPEHLPLWLGRVLHEVELDGEIVEQPAKLVAARGRLVRRVDVWDDAAHAAYTRMCADRAHALVRGRDLEGWAAAIEPSVANGGAVLGFIAASIAERIDGPDGYARERAAQAAWLIDRLGLAA